MIPIQISRSVYNPVLERTGSTMSGINSTLKCLDWLHSLKRACLVLLTMGLDAYIR